MAQTDFVIDRVNSEEISPIKLKNISEITKDDELVVNSPVKIKTLLKNNSKGINTIEISSQPEGERLAARLIIDIEI